MPDNLLNEAEESFLQTFARKSSCLIADLTFNQRVFYLHQPECGNPILSVN